MLLRRSILALGLLRAALLAAQAPGFIENRGQWPAPVTFRASTPEAVLWCERGSVVIDRFDAAAVGRHHAPGADHYDPAAPWTVHHHALRLRFLEAAPDIRSEGLGVKPGAYNYLIGNDRSRWAANAHAFSAVLQRGIVPGVDLRLRTGPDVLKYDLIVAPSADPARIRFTYDGADGLALRDGKLIVRTSLGEMIEAIPLAYQERDGRRIPVECRYALARRTVSFVLGDHDPSLELVIDPTLAFSTYSGSTTDNFGYTASFDDKGFLYAGSSAFGQGYPTTLGAYDTTWNGGEGNLNSGTDIALSKFDTTGTHLIWSTFLGGSGDDLPHSLIVDPNGELIVLGTTGSADFPTTDGAYDASFGGGTDFQPEGLGTHYPDGTDMIVARLDADGAALLGSTYIGGSANDGINSAPGLKFNYADEIRGEVLLDAAGNVVVASCTQSADFPVTSGAYRTAFAGGSHDAVLLTLDPMLTALEWSTFFGGSAADAAYAMEIDAAGTVYITGGTASADLPASADAWSNAFQGGPADGFIAAIGADGSALEACSYYGSSAYDQAYFVEMDEGENIYLFGQTRAAAGELIANAPYFVPDGGQLLAKLSHDLTTRLWGSRFGATSGAGAGQPNISPTAFLVDYCDKIYVSGWGSSILGAPLTTNGLPHTPDAYQPTTDGRDFYLAVFDIDMQGSGPIYATFFGGPQSSEHVDGGTSRLDRRGRVYQAVCAGCGSHDDFPTTPGALSATNNSPNCNLAVFKFDFEAPLVIAGLAAPDTLCANAPVPFTNTSQLAVGHLWDFGDTHTSMEVAPQHTYAAPGTYTVTLTVTNANACNAQDAASIQVTVLGEAPDLQAMDDVSLCGPTASLLLTATSHGTASSYIWSASPSFTDPLNPSPGDSTALLAPPTGGTYYVQASEPGHCPATDEVVVSTSLTGASLSPDVSICADGSATLTLTGIDPGSTILWSPADSVDTGQGTTQITASPTVSTVFEVAVTSPTGCAWADEVLVAVSPMNGGSVDATADPAIVDPGGTTVQLQAIPGSGVSYSWSPPDAVSDPTIASPTAFVTQSTTFYVVVSDGVCSRMDSVRVEVYELRCEEPDIFIPDAFTPNGDSNNDVLFVRGRHIRDLELKVFDRWGEVVFATTDQAKGWDATYKGRPVDPAVYVYWLTAHCIDGQEFFKKGNVTVIR